MAVGISCAATGMRAALDLLAPLLTDAVDFVRQGALIANALVLMQQPESKVSCPVFCARSGISNGYIYDMSGSTPSASASPWGWSECRLLLPAPALCHGGSPCAALIASEDTVYSFVDLLGSLPKLVGREVPLPRRLESVLSMGCTLQVAAFRKRLEKVVGDKHEEVMGRMGAIMATGVPACPLAFQYLLLRTCPLAPLSFTRLCAEALHPQVNALLCACLYHSYTARQQAPAARCNGSPSHGSLLFFGIDWFRQGS